MRQDATCAVRQLAGAGEHRQDLELARQALAGSRTARRIFIERMHCVPRMLAAKNARLARPLGADDLEDLTQEILLAIWRRLDTYAGLSSLETWAYRFCHLALLNSLRERARSAGGPPSLESAADDASLNKLIEFDNLYTAIQGLGRTHARVVRMKHFELRTFEEIAGLLRMSVSTAKTHYYRAVEKLRAVLGAAERTVQP